MKKIKILVEGIADLKFFRDYFKHLYPNIILKTDIDEKDNKFIEFIYNGYEVVLKRIGGCDNISIVKNELENSLNNGYENIIVFDADTNFATKKEQIEKKFKNLYKDLFLIPNNCNTGCLEDLLENIMTDKRPAECWSEYEKNIILKKLNILSKKTKIYVWLENILGSSVKSKKLCKEVNRDYTNKNIWNLNSEFLEPLKIFIDKNIQ